jgi:hypothetical protein
MTDKDDGQGGPRPSDKAPNPPETLSASSNVENGGIAGNNANPSRVATDCVVITVRAADLERLVVAARHVAFDGFFDGCSPEAAELLKKLDAASEAFAAAFPWEDEPDDDETVATVFPGMVENLKLDGETIHVALHSSRDQGDGPFTVKREHLTALVMDASDEVFCVVNVRDCVGRDGDAAKARATRIAESLNKTEGHTT